MCNPIFLIGEASSSFVIEELHNGMVEKHAWIWAW